MCKSVQNKYYSNDDVLQCYKVNVLSFKNQMYLLYFSENLSLCSNTAHFGRGNKKIHFSL